MTMAPDLGPIKARLQAAREAAARKFRETRKPDPLLAAMRRAVDQALRDLLTLCPLPAGAALAAVGGYGRGELYPHSDVDLLILLPHHRNEGGGAATAPSDEALVGALVAALWDLGLEPGYSVRTVAECESEAQADITVETALLESRWLAGDRELMRQFEGAMSKRLNARQFFLAKRIEMQQRHASFRDSPYSLEPNCKESPGGMRDLQVIMWMARAAGSGGSWKEIAQAGLLTAPEARALKRVEQAFKRLRIELHLLTHRREDRLLFDLQPALADIYGIESTPTRRASELVMQRYYWAARLVTQLNVILVQNIEERLFPRPESDAQPIDADFRKLHDRLDIIRDDAFEQNPSLLLRAFLVMQQHADLTGMSARTMRAIWHARDRIDAKFRRDPANRALFLEILQQPRGIVHEIRRMAMLNVLPRYLPPFRKIVGQMQHDLFHLYTVDQHTLTVLRNVRRFTMPEHASEFPLASQLISGLQRHWLLYVAALFHDIAKGRGGDHSQLGAVEARRFARAHALTKEDAELVEFLVREHLSMSSVAQKQDLSDPAVIRAFADKVGDQRHLDALYVLTVADVRGTSPKVWNAWKAKLLEDLYYLTLAALGGASADTPTVLNERRAQAAELARAAGVSDAAREAFWKQLDVAYFLRHAAEEIAWHTAVLSGGAAPAAPVVRARPIDRGDNIEIVLYMPDVPRIFAATCSVFDAHSFSIQDARVHTTRHGWALDSYIVLPPEGAHASLGVLAREIEASLSQQLLHPNAAVAANNVVRRSRLSRAFPVQPKAELYPDENSKSWRLAVTATDRPGLLHALARVFADHEVTLITAKITTLGDRVEDIFIISGSELERSRSQMQFERAVLEALAT